ncbi:pilus assembly protein TadG-related protein [Thermincola ferriacetica]
MGIRNSVLEKFLANEKGTVTIYLVIVFMIMVIFIGLFIDLARIKTAQNQLRRVANAAACSVLADYDTCTKQDFGLFTYKGTNYDQDFAKYVKANLTSSAGQNFNLLDYRYEGSQADVNNSLAEEAVLKQQILEDMKYRAPIELGQFITDKIRVIGKMFNFFQAKNQERKSLDTIKKKSREIDKIGRDIERKKKDLISKRERLEELEEELARAQDAETRKAIRKEMAKVKEEIKLLKEEISGDLERCQRLSREVDEERGKLIEGGYMGSTDGKDEIDMAIEESEKSINAEVQRIQLNIEREMTKVNREIAASLDALDHDQYERIGLTAVNVVISEYETVSASAYGNELRRQQSELENEISQKNILEGEGIIEPKDITGKVDDFEENNGKDIEQIAEKVNGVVAIDEVLTDMRDDLYINEYILAHFSYLTKPAAGKNFMYKYWNSEAEYITFGGAYPRARAVGEIYLIRFGLDTMAYLCFSKVAPAEPVARFIYSVIMGVTHAGVDTLKLLLGQTVAIAEMYDPTYAFGNPLHDIRTNYKEHLRLLLFINNDDNKLRRIQEIIRLRNNVDPKNLNTVLTGSAEVSIRLWFLPLAGIRNMEHGPFGTTVKDGRCYITKRVEYGY